MAGENRPILERNIEKDTEKNGPDIHPGDIEEYCFEVFLYAEAQLLAEYRFADHLQGLGKKQQRCLHGDDNVCGLAAFLVHCRVPYLPTPYKYFLLYYMHCPAICQCKKHEYMFAFFA
ncbi:MAG: hypothetical protein IKC28_09255 [Clostridia bacterium]|nr:hypothetical protein [Clostridia bacterium]